MRIVAGSVFVRGRQIYDYFYAYIIRSVNASPEARRVGRMGLTTGAFSRRI